MTLFFYILAEIIPQFITSFAVISSILVISQLVRLSDIIINFGLSIENVMMPFLFIILPFLSFTIPMSALFAVLLAFSRLSVDGELTAMLAAGFSIRRALTPVLIFACTLYCFAAVSATYLEPWGRRELINFYNRKSQSELDDMIRFRLSSGVFLNNFLGFTLYAEKISEDRSHFENVLLAPGKHHRDNYFTIMAPVGTITGSIATQDLRMSFSYGSMHAIDPSGVDTSVVKFKHVELDLLRLFQDQIFGGQAFSDDHRGYRPEMLMQYIEELRVQSLEDERLLPKYRKAHYLFHQRFALPFATVTFCLFAIVFGISDPRKGKSHAFVYAISVIILSYIAMMAAQWIGENGYMTAPYAAWTPNMIILAIASFLVYQRNRLPPSESLLSKGYRRIE